MGMISASGGHCRFFSVSVVVRAFHRPMIAQIDTIDFGRGRVTEHIGAGPTNDRDPA
jgi:hypothetical protein